MHHPVSCARAIRVVRQKVISQQTRNARWASTQAALEPAESQHAKRLMQNLGKICEWQAGGRSHHLPPQVCYGPCCETTSRTAAQCYHQVMEKERLIEAPRRDHKSWHGVGERPASSFSPQKGTLKAQEGSGTKWGSGNHTPQIWVGGPSTRLSSLSLCIWEFTSGVNWIPGQSELVRLLYKPDPSPRLQPVQEKSIL